MSGGPVEERVKSITPYDARLIEGAVALAIAMAAVRDYLLEREQYQAQERASEITSETGRRP